LVAPVFVVALLDLLSLAASPPLSEPLWGEESLVLVPEEVLAVGVVTPVVAVFKSETVVLIA